MEVLGLLDPLVLVRLAPLERLLLSFERLLSRLPDGFFFSDIPVTGCKKNIKPARTLQIMCDYTE